ncbi:MAG: hypothetical protein LBP53_08400 [Candidatus Peribacteria bacterium]|jgi:hypothetical protein|nr:hypothetical protein [Candidatus Peribacteria bacterium]
MTHIIRKGKAEEYFSPEELAQVGSICGIDNIATMTQKQMLGCEVKLKLASAKSSLKKTWNDTKKAFQSTRMVKKVDEDTNIPEPPQQSQKTVGEMYVDASLEEAFGNSFSTVSTVYEEMQGDLIAMEFSVSLFSSLLQQIDELEGKVIGANGSGLIKVLNDICTYQCANK